MDKSLLEKARAVMRRATAESNSQNIAQEATEAPVNPVTLTAVLADTDVQDVERILEVWKRVFDMKLDRNMVIDHLRNLREWRRRK
jgi:hypothetical protein